MELAIKKIKELIESYDYWIRDFQPYFRESKENSDKRINELKDTYEQLKSILDSITWISVKDRLPVFGLHKVVAVSGVIENRRYVYYAETHSYGEKEKAEDIFSLPGWSKMNVTHWMPMPKFNEKE